MEDPYQSPPLPPSPTQKRDSPFRHAPGQQFSLLLLLAASFLSILVWIVLLASVAALQVTLSKNNTFTDRSISEELTLSWVITFGFLLFVVTLAVMSFVSIRRPRVLRRAALGLLFFLAILISWAGMEAKMALALVRSTVRLPTLLELDFVAQQSWSTNFLGSLAVMSVASIRKPRVLRRAAPGLPFFIAILINWSGVEANRALAFVRSTVDADIDATEVGSRFLARARSWAAGLILMLIVSCVIAILLLNYHAAKHPVREMPQATDLPNLQMNEAYGANDMGYERMDPQTFPSGNLPPRHVYSGPRQYM